MSLVTTWPAAVDEILAGDQAVAFAHVTPASGVVLTPLTNIGLRDPRAGAVSPVSSSVGMWKKLARIQANPRVAVAFHTRAHSFSERPEYVLVQGTASLTPPERRDWIERHLEGWERFAGPRQVGRLWERWLAVYHWRVGVEIEVERIVAWPDLRCQGEPEVHGIASPERSPGPQAEPAKGTGPRVRHGRAARRAARLPHVLLAWVGSDGFPVVVPVDVRGAGDRGILLAAPQGLVPPGGRRAGLLAHSFARHTIGQHQRRHTGWLEAESRAGRLVYAPHTESGYHLPASRFLFRLTSGFVTRRGLRGARAAGFVP
jgi:hypothetical protein